jgi:hypothetical protein
MTRERLPDRRHSLTVRVPVTLDGGKEQVVLATIGFADVEMTQPREVFCADFKAGTAMHAVMTDGCILLSRLLQHGDLPSELVASMCQPPSVLGSVAAAVAAQVRDNVEREWNGEEGK